MANNDHPSGLPAVFNFGTHSIRTIDKDGEIWFVANDVCAVLDLHSTATRRLDDDEKGLRLMQTPSGVQEVGIINESGLYSLVLRSRKPEAKQFKRWVTHEVLPAIRKTGRYELTEKPEEAVPVPVPVLLPGYGRYCVTATPEGTTIEDAEDRSILVNADLCNLRALTSLFSIADKAWKKQLYPALRLMESPLASRLIDAFNDGAIVSGFFERRYGKEMDEEQKRMQRLTIEARQQSRS